MCEWCASWKVSEEDVEDEVWLNEIRLKEELLNEPVSIKADTGEWVYALETNVKGD